MGGHAVMNVRRYAAEEYYLLVEEVLGKLRALFPGHRIEVLQAFRRKESFGDMDILLESFDFSKINFKAMFIENFKATQVVANGPVYSFDYRQFQIDVNLVAPHLFEMAMNYFSWNDLGNFMGRIAHKFGFKYGHEGLIYVFREQDYQFGEIVVSRDMAQICRFLGYDPEVFAQGFDTLEEIFSFTSSTPFFNKSIYHYDNRNHTSRTRDRKRGNYHAFLEWIRDKPTAEYPWETFSERGGRVTTAEHMSRAFRFFPEFEKEYERMVVQFNQWKRAKELLNGRVVASVTGLTGQPLGHFMKWLKESQPERATLARMMPGEVETWVKVRYEEFKGEYYSNP